MTAQAIALATLAGSAVSIASVHAACGALRRRFGPRLAYACWMLPWCSVAASLFPSHGAAVRLFAWSGEASRRIAAHLPIGAVQATVVLAVWAAVALLFLFVHLGAYLAFMRRATRGAVELHRAGPVPVLRSAGVAVPIAAGIFRRRIFVPLDFDRVLLPQERAMALRHEAAHHERHDVTANLAALALLSLHWWNPLAHRAHRRFRADQELACDAHVTAGLDPVARHAYGMAILKCAGRGGTVLAAALSGRDEIAARLRAIASPAPEHRRSRLPAIAAVAGLASIALVDGAGPRGIATTPDVIARAAPRTASLAPDADPGGRWTGLCDAPQRTPDPVSLPDVRPAWTTTDRLILASMRSGPPRTG